jgi:hypothetical protein
MPSLQPHPSVEDRSSAHQYKIDTLYMVVSLNFYYQLDNTDAEQALSEQKHIPTHPLAEYRLNDGYFKHTAGKYVLNKRDISVAQYIGS